MNKSAKLHTDGGSRGNPGPAGIGFVLDIDDEDKIKGSDYIGKATNNVAEYKALIAGLEAAIKQNVSELEVFMDSELIIKQMKGIYRVKHVAMKPLYAKVQDLKDNFIKINFKHVKREKNQEADALVNKALDKVSK